MRFIVSFLTIALLVPSLALPAQAQGSAGAALQERLQRVGDSTYQGQSREQLPEVVGNLIKTFLSVLGVLFVVLTVYAGYLWMNARGNDTQVNKAKEILTQSVIGFIIIMAAYTITHFVVAGLSKATGYQEGPAAGSGRSLPGAGNSFGNP